MRDSGGDKNVLFLEKKMKYQLINFIVSMKYPGCDTVKLFYKMPPLGEIEQIVHRILCTNFLAIHVNLQLSQNENSIIFFKKPTSWVLDCFLFTFLSVIFAYNFL